MMEQSLQEMLTERFGPDGVRKVFYFGQFLLVGIFLGGFFYLRSKGPDSAFAVREADRKKKPSARGPGSGPDLAQARLDLKRPLQLEGIRIDGPPHEILGVSLGASALEVQKAYRDRMKQYHPDKVGRQGSREWEDAQKIAEAVNRAKVEMLKRLSSKS
jgi:hypothetical protein